MGKCFCRFAFLICHYSNFAFHTYHWYRLGMRTLIIISVLFFSLILGVPSQTADFNKGLTAAQNGDYATALKEWKPLAEEGNAAAQNNLGLMYCCGWGVRQDYKEAARLYRLAAEQGDPRGQVNLGLMYAKGKSVMPDNIYAYMWLYIASLTGDRNAISNRDIIAKKMTSSDIFSAQVLGNRCITKKYKRC